MKKRTKILATVGPASDSLEKIEALVRAGVNVFRLNFSHGTYEYHLGVLNKIRQVMQSTGLIVGVLQDISGPKIRIGELEDNFELQEGNTIIFHKDTIVGRCIDIGRYEVSINYPEILTQLHVGDYIYLYDGIIRTKVIACSAENIEVIVENNGTLSSKKGVNFPNTELGIDILTKKDRADIEWGVKNDVDFMAISFVQNAIDMINAREIVKKHGGNQMLIAKIEKFDAIKNIDAILEASDGLMVARGDLGIEVPFYEVPNLQKMLIHKANLAAKPVITATQMLLSMTHSERATRAEISDIANAVLDGTDAVMLSEESAVGNHPVLAVRTMFETIRETEKSYAYHRVYNQKHDDVTNAIDESAVKLAKDLEVDAIFAVTATGGSARSLSKYRPKSTIYAVTHDDRVRQQLTLSWGIIPAFSVENISIGRTIKDIMQKGLDDKILDLKKSYILTAGDPVGGTGSTNTIRFLREHEMEFFRTLEI
ncbi:pyruvate kinase [Candidatus Sulfurimonas baltica]|uniref:Pyruvate kinase n=1 Tax=Candidatus Sulfurimonas baltica TaxID=2740404 RepID=A0A7S7RM35_9BACT|nr:pyruvate kinase [Candidatus Sulfurimonas baltica]QOY51747.1 pyruvate kinase [Candidatus Sulfurimonas baltica]